MNFKRQSASATEQHCPAKYVSVSDSNLALVSELERENLELRRANKILRALANFLAQQNSERKAKAPVINSV
jgi:hypothetical protein